MAPILRLHTVIGYHGTRVDGGRGPPYGSGNCTAWTDGIAWAVPAIMPAAQGRRVGRAHHVPTRPYGGPCPPCCRTGHRLTLDGDAPMPRYLRYTPSGATFFFTVVTNGRRPLFRDAAAIGMLGDAMRKVRASMRFEMPAFVILPDHLHCLWTLPEGDSDYSKRWSCIKRLFTKRWLSAGETEGPISPSRASKRERGVWQRRFWEHTIRDERDYIRCVEYVHFNPVKHGHAECPHGWKHSSFHRWVELDHCPRDWQCVCDRRERTPIDFSDVARSVGE